MVERLIESGGDVDCVSRGGETPLMKAICFDHGDVVRVLLDNKADPNIQNIAGRSSYDFAKSSKNPEILHILKLDLDGDAEMPD